MVHLTKALALLASSAAVLVSASPMPAPTAAPDLKDAATLEKRASCTFTDAAAASKSKTSCATIVLSNIAVPSGTTLDMTKLNDGTNVIFEGTTTFGYEAWSGPLISFSGKNLAISGASGHSINGNGAKWWDGKGSNGGVTKPKFFYAHSITGTSTIKGLNILNTPVQGFSIDGSSGLTLDSITIDNSAGSSLGHNTDAFDVGSSTNIVISNANIKNQDDCLAINSGTGITFTGGTCSGGHGLSIGSVGGRSDNVVSDVTIESSTVTSSDNGIRIKTVYGATGSVKTVTFKDIKVSSIAKYGIVIEQDYENGSPTGTPTSGVPITGLTVNGVTGTVSSSGTNIYILCGSGACSGWTWTGVSISGGKTSSSCKNVPSGASC